jgi:hypothetical protein
MNVNIIYFLIGERERDKEGRKGERDRHIDRDTETMTQRHIDRDNRQ